MLDSQTYLRTLQASFTFYSADNMSPSFVCQTCGKALTCQKSLDRHLFTVHVPWFAREVLCEYCEKAFETGNTLSDHMGNQDHRARVKAAQAQRRKLKRWQEMRREYFTRHGWTWTEAVSVQSTSNGHGNPQNTGTVVAGEPVTPLLDERLPSDDFTSILEVASQLSNEEISPVGIDPPGFIDSEPPSKRPRTAGLRETISARSVTEQNRLLAEAIDEQSHQLSHLSRTLAQLAGSMGQLTDEVRRLANDNMQGFQKTRGNIRDLSTTIHEGLENVNKTCTTRGDQATIDRITRDKTLVNLIGPKHVEHGGSFMGCTICLGEWTRVESLLQGLN